MALFPAERRCAICNKEFLGYSQWVYKRGESWFCSYGCLQKHEKKKKRSRAERVHRLDATERSEIRKLLTLGVAPQKIANKVGVSVQAIIYYQQKAEA